MKKIHMIQVFIIALIMVSCAGIDTTPEPLKPIHQRLYSQDADVKLMAEKQFETLSADDKKEVLLMTAAQLEKESDADTQVRIIKALADNGAGSYVIPSLIKALAVNTKLTITATINDFINKAQPAEEEMAEKIASYLNEGSSKARQAAYLALGKMSVKAKKAVPQIIDAMHKFGSDAAEYANGFEALAKIDPEIAVASAIKDLENTAVDIRRNSLEKLIGIQTYMNSKLPAVKEVATALLRIIYSEDSGLKKLVEENINTEDAAAIKAEMDKYMKTGARLMGVLSKTLGVTMDDIFKAQDERLDGKLKKFYEDIGKEYKE
ncbi:MAG: hypothetical protein CVV21_06985 [Candidatus Goldiibacteriota bacterium HGW-Goldbacteria-1]|nr:MAG: hypothetical protein CVV21_06985 [Candidatus Goldiibacteriota bacterium HGW-Goldbacteria-1]